MRLKRLEMVGFKSFAQRTVLDFTPGITAIVGPNGCGKSNVVDALRWVMGEQSARHLRGHLMEDVIFNGSETLVPTGMAEASLIFDNEDGRGPAEYSGFSEIMVTRRLFRSGESEYSINKVPCRLKDIIELFLGTGVGNKAYSVVEQGRVDELVNAKPEERRAIIEEAAGTSKYKSRKLVAERKLERTQQNLLRVGDIVREIERQIRSMELQAKKAERYRALKNEFKEKELAWAALRRKALEEELAAHEDKVKAVGDRLAALAASLHAKEAEAEKTKLALLETEQEIGAQQEAVYQHKVQIQGEEQRIEFYQKELVGLEAARVKDESELHQMREKLRALAAEIAELQRAQEEFVQLSLFEEANLKDKEQELERIKAQIRELQGEVEREKEALIGAANQGAHLKNESMLKEKQRGEAERELARSRQEKTEALRILESGRKKQGERKSALERCLERAGKVEREAAEAAGAAEKWSKLQAEHEAAIASLKERLHETRSRLASLEALQKNYEGYQEGVRAIMLKQKRESAFKGVHGLVAEVVEAPEQYEKALTAVLGERLQYVIVRGHEEGLEAIEYLKRESSGRGSFIPRQLLRREKRALPLTEPEVIAPLLDIVAVKKGFKEIAEYLLGDVVMVRDLKSGLGLWSRNGFLCTLVTPEGEVIDSTGVVTGGSLEGLEGSLLAQRRHMKELEAGLAELDSRLAREQKKASELKEQIEKTEAQRAALIEDSHRLALERTRLELELTQSEQELERLEGNVRMLQQEEDDLSAALRALMDEMKKGQAEMAALLQKQTGRQKNLAEKQSLLTQLTQRAATLEGEVTEARIRGAALGEKKENAHRNLEIRVKIQRELSDQAGAREVEVADAGRKIEHLKEAARSAEQSLADGRKALGALEEKLEERRRRYRQVSRQLAILEEAIKEIRPAAEAAQEEKNRLQLILSEKRLTLQHLFENIREKYDVDLKETPCEAPAAVSEGELSAEIEELRERLERMGEVNLAAIGEFEELNSRYQFLSRQKQDLEQSMADLQRTIVKLNRICRLRFKESFEEINQRFEEIFPRLFRGGKARLVLTDENDYLETGVDIIAQPPGKKLQQITLLSGGEKALTAVSLLFAIFLTKPSPFCFLDEVDAPLDDANLDRFNEMIHEMSQNSQFILITHNKRTMQAAEVLYGITMAEPGVSKVVSVRMS